LSLSGGGAINFVIAGGIRDEVLHPATPIEKKAVVIPQIYNLRPSRNSQQEAERRAVAAILQGNAKPETHAADASHLSEAAETGCAYFVTEDARILRKRAELAGVLPPSLQIVTLEEFLACTTDTSAANTSEGGSSAKSSLFQWLALCAPLSTLRRNQDWPAWKYV